MKSDIGKAADAEKSVEAAVTAYLGRLPFLWLPIDDKPGPKSLRGLIERNVIALVSSLHEPVIDPPSPSWLGFYSGREKSGVLACGTSGM